jgi:hypothetical protein
VEPSPFDGPLVIPVPIVGAAKKREGLPIWKKMQVVCCRTSMGVITFSRDLDKSERAREAFRHVKQQ